MPRTRQVPGGERLVEAGPPSEAARLEVAAEDLLIGRPDLGPGARTLITAGSPIPPGLVDQPRHPRVPKPRRRS